MAQKSNIIIFADGWVEWGGSGARKLLEKIASGDINARVITLVSGYPNGGVAKLSEEFWIPFEYINFPKRTKQVIDGVEKRVFTPQQIQEISYFYSALMETYPDYIFLSGWMRYVIDLPENCTVNIHPGPTQGEFGWLGMYGDKVHQKVWEKYQNGEVTSSVVTMHFVTDAIDGGPIICQIPVPLEGITKWEDIKERANKGTEHKYQWIITKLITERKIQFQDGKVVWSPEITREYMKEQFGVEWDVQWQTWLPEFEAFKK